MLDCRESAWDSCICLLLCSLSPFWCSILISQLCTCWKHPIKVPRLETIMFEMCWILVVYPSMINFCSRWSLSGRVGRQATAQLPILRYAHSIRHVGFLSHGGSPVVTIGFNTKSWFHDWMTWGYSHWKPLRVQSSGTSPPEPLARPLGWLDSWLTSLVLYGLFIIIIIIIIHKPLTIGGAPPVMFIGLDINFIYQPSTPFKLQK